MAVYRVLTSPAVEHQLDRLPKTIHQRVLTAILALTENPRPPGSRKLRHSKIGDYRIRIGDYRVIYDVNDTAKEVTLLRVEHRKDVYRR
jgi:mRNA interferase RelE/StbE